MRMLLESALLKMADYKKIEKWNSKVAPCDTVYHMGKFGDDWVLKYLTGTTKIINSIPLNEHSL